MPAEEIMRKFRAGTLHSGSRSGPKVTSLEQAKAIAASYNEKPHGKRKVRHRIGKRKR